MSAEQITREVIVWTSAYSVGTAVFAAALCLRMVRANRRRYLSFAAAKLGYALVVATVLLRIILPNIEGFSPADPYVSAYGLGLALAGIGFTGVGRAIRNEYVEWESKHKTHPAEPPPES